MRTGRDFDPRPPARAERYHAQSMAGTGRSGGRRHGGMGRPPDLPLVSLRGGVGSPVGRLGGRAWRRSSPAPVAQSSCPPPGRPASRVARRPDRELARTVAHLTGLARCGLFADWRRGPTRARGTFGLRGVRDDRLLAPGTDGTLRGRRRDAGRLVACRPRCALSKASAVWGSGRWRAVFPDGLKRCSTGRTVRAPLTSGVCDFRAEGVLPVTIRPPGRLPSHV